MHNRFNLSRLCNLLPHLRKEIRIKVERDYIVLLSASEMVSNGNLR